MEPREALALVRRSGVVMLTPQGRLPSLVAAVSGGPIRGSWWSHPDGPRIYACAEALDASGEVLSVKLVAGKVSFVHRALWPALFRIVTDRRWRAAASREVAAGTRALLARVQRADRRLDVLAEERPGERAALTRAKDEIEARLLAYTESLHTERGRHTTLLRSWQRWAQPGLAEEASALPFAEALERLRGACRGARTALG